MFFSDQNSKKRYCKGVITYILLLLISLAPCRSTVW